MKVGIIGRTRWLLDAAIKLHKADCKIVFVATANPSSEYKADIRDFEDFAKNVGARFCKGKELVSDEVVDWLLNQQCDLSISANWPTILPEKIRSCFKMGILNAHAGDLPAYRGNACPNWAILNGEDRMGLTVHLMIDDLDGGDILLKKYCPINSDTYIGDLYKFLDEMTPELLFEAAIGLSNGSLQPIPQSTFDSRPHRCYPRRPLDARIDWSNSVSEIERLVRASSRPFAGATTQIDSGSGKKVTIWRASVAALNDIKISAVPGQVCGMDSDDVLVATKTGLLRIEEVDVGCQSGQVAKAILCGSARNRLI